MQPPPGAPPGQGRRTDKENGHHTAHLTPRPGTSPPLPPRPPRGLGSHTRASMRSLTSLIMGPSSRSFLIASHQESGGKERRQKRLGLSCVARPLVMGEEVSEGCAMGAGSGSHFTRGGVGMLASGWASGSPTKKKRQGLCAWGSWHVGRNLKAGQGRGRVGSSSLWISMSSGRLGKSRASSSRGSRPSFFIRW